MNARTSSFNETRLKIWFCAAWLLAAVLALFHAWMLHRLVVNFPFQDDFTQLLTVPGDVDDIRSLGAKIAYLLASSGDHRVITLRLAALFQAKVLGEINFRALVFFGNLLCAATGLLVLSAARAPVRPWLAPLIAALLFSPTNWLPQYWASAALQHYSVLAYAFGALFCLNRQGIAWQAGGLVLGLCAAMTGANGLMVLPVGAALLYGLGRRRTSALWIGLTILIFAVYFIDYRPPPGRAPPLDSLQHPLTLLVLFVCTLGSLAERFDYAVAIGTILIAAWAWLIGSSRARGIPPILLAWMGFLLLCVGTIAFGRAPFGSEAILNSRYRIYSEMTIIVTVIAVLWRTRAWQTKLLLTILLPVIGVWFGRSWESNLPALADLLTQQRTSLTHYALTGQGIYRGFPPQDATDDLLKRAYDDGYFRPVRASHSGAILIETDSLPVQTGSLGLWTEAPILDATTITVRGFAHVNEPDPILVWLEGGSHLFQGRLQTQRIINPAGADWTIFWNTLLRPGVAPGGYRVGYSSGDANPPVVDWGSNLLEIK